MVRSEELLANGGQDDGPTLEDGSKDPSVQETAERNGSGIEAESVAAFYGGFLAR